MEQTREGEQVSAASVFRRWALGVLVVAVTLLATTTSASAAVKWELLSTANTTAAPGEEFEYGIRIRNLGKSATPPDNPAVFTATLPDGLSLVSIVAEGAYACSGVAGSQTATCMSTDPVPPAVEPFELQSAFVKVVVDPAASGVLTAKFTLSGGGASVAPVSTVDPTTITAEPLEFGADAFEVSFSDSKGVPFTKAGGHPDRLGIRLDLNRETHPVYGPIWPTGYFRGYVLDLPAGFGFNPTNFARCTEEQLAYATEGFFPIRALSRCPVGSQIGMSKSASAFVSDLAADIFASPASLYNMVPPPGAFARFGSNVGGTLTITDAFVRSGGHGFTLKLWNSSRALGLNTFDVDIWNDPGNPSNSWQRSCPGEELPSVGGPVCASSTLEEPFLRNPTSCSPPGKGLTSTARLTAWEDPDSPVAVTSTTHKLPGYPASPNDPETPWGEEVGTTNCDAVPVRGDVTVRPTILEARAPAGLDVKVSIPNAGLENVHGTAASDIKSMKLVLPEGVSINPSRAEGLDTCSAAQFAGESTRFVPGSGCPDASKIGAVSVETPYLAEPLAGSVFVARPDDLSTEGQGAENPFDSMIALYVVIRNAERGVVVKLAGEVDADPVTGQLTVNVGDIPEQPFSSFSLHLDDGVRSPLVMPTSCGRFTTETELTPWSDPSRSISSTSSFAIERGRGGSACDAEGGEPRWKAGSLRNRAGSFSPFVAQLDSTMSAREIAELSIEFPPGLAASLAGVARCSDADIAAIQRDSGRNASTGQLCRASKVGHVIAGFGVGAVQAHSTGAIFLAGPYRGTPISVATVIPAVVGPFDLGTIVQRSALEVDPRSAAVVLDGSRSAPFPSVLGGVGLHLGSIRIHLDRRHFTLNPTRCDTKAVVARFGASGADLTSPSDGSTIELSNPFEVVGCSSLGFRPRLALALSGDDSRGGHPALVSTMRTRSGDSNIRRAELQLPDSLLLDARNIGAACAKSKLRKGACPKSTVYGTATAVTPLLGRSLRGRVHLVASGRSLPDLAISLEGQVDLDLRGHLFSGKHGAGFVLAGLPDVPIERLKLRIDGGPDGLLVNARNPCRGESRVELRLASQDGRRTRSMPAMACR